MGPDLPSNENARRGKSGRSTPDGTASSLQKIGELISENQRTHSGALGEACRYARTMHLVFADANVLYSRTLRDWTFLLSEESGMYSVMSAREAVVEAMGSN